MKIIIPAIGSRGDVQPFIALCQGLQAAGHAPLLATNPTLVGLVESHGIPAAPVGPPVDMGAAGAEIMVKAGRNWWIGMLRTMQLGFKLVQEAYPDLRNLVSKNDLVVVTDTYAGAAEAEQAGVPWISVTLQPARVPVANPDVSLMMKLFFPIANRFIMAPINNFCRKIGLGRLKDMGTTASALRAGKPAVVIPHIIDQLYWADRVTKLGAGPRFIHRTHLTAGKLASALRQAASDPALQTCAAEIGSSIRAEPDGIKTAVRWIEHAVH